MSDPVPVKPVIVGRRPPAGPAATQHGAPGSAGARIFGQFGEEVAERLTKDYLAGNPGTLARAALAIAAKYPELATKLAGISVSELNRELIFRVLQRMGVNTDAGLVRALADTPDNVIRGVVEAFAETAKNGPPPPPAKPTAAPAVDPVPVVAHGTMVIRSRVMSGETANHVHRTVGAACKCLVFRTAKDRWDNDHKPTLLKDEGKGGGKERGPRASVKLADAEPFPCEILSIGDAQEIGYTECPTCKPYTKAAEEAKPKEASVADTPHDAAGHPASATNEKKPAPIEGWAEKVGTIGRWLLAVFAATLENTDFGNEVRTLNPTVWKERARFLAHKYLADTGGGQQDDFAPDGSFKPLTAAQFSALPTRLTPEEAEDLVRLVFVAGEGHATLPTKVEEILARLRGKKTGKDENPAAAAIAAAKTKLANAKGPLDENAARAELAALEPKKPSHWLRYSIITAVVVIVLVVLGCVGVIINGVAAAVSAETPVAATSAAGRK